MYFFTKNVSGLQAVIWNALHWSLIWSVILNHFPIFADEAVTIEAGNAWQFLTIPNDSSASQGWLRKEERKTHFGPTSSCSMNILKAIIKSAQTPRHCIEADEVYIEICHKVRLKDMHTIFCVLTHQFLSCLALFATLMYSAESYEGQS